MPRGCRSVKSFKDPVHGYVDICGGAARVVDSWLVQRLRRIRQTAFAYLVYHGMEHSRFNHSLGAAHLAGEVLSFVSDNTRLYFRTSGAEQFANTLLASTEVFQLAALVHDLGHLPFSHSSEVGVAEAVLLHSARGFDKIPLRHEAYTYSLLDMVGALAEEAGVEPVFTSRVADDLRLILQGSSQATAGDYESACASEVLHHLIAGGLDVDRMDYLIRDSLYAGVRYGVFDVDRLVRVLLASPLLLDGRGVSERACQVLVLDKGVSIVEAFLLARLYMFSEVYLHRVVEAYNSVYARLFGLLASEGLITAGAGSGGELEIPSPDELASGSREALEAWRELDDHSMLHLLRGVHRGRLRASAEARELASMLLERRHPRIYRVVEDKKIWGLYTGYLYDGYAPSWAKPLLDELLDLQRSHPLLMVRPLRVDVISLEKIGVYNRSTGEATGLEEDAGGLARLRRLAELSLHRVAVFAPRSEEKAVEKALRILGELRSAASREERA